MGEFGYGGFVSICLTISSFLLNEGEIAIVTFD
jgi:hypothetical protein